MTHQPLFEVTHVWRFKLIEITIRHKNGESEELPGINRKDYEKWLEDTDRLQFTNKNGYDIPRYHPDEYWEFASERTILQHAYEYILLHDKNIFEDIENSIRSICKDYQEQK